MEVGDVVEPATVKSRESNSLPDARLARTPIGRVDHGRDDHEQQRHAKILVAALDHENSHCGGRDEPGRRVEVNAPGEQLVSHLSVLDRIFHCSDYIFQLSSPELLLQ